VSSLLSFISIQTENKKREAILEKVANYFFVISLAGIFFIILFIFINFWHK